MGGRDDRSTLRAISALVQELGSNRLAHDDDERREDRGALREVPDPLHPEQRGAPWWRPFRLSGLVTLLVILETGNASGSSDLLPGRIYPRTSLIWPDLPKPEEMLGVRSLGRTLSRPLGSLPRRSKVRGGAR